MIAYPTVLGYDIDARRAASLHEGSSGVVATPRLRLPHLPQLHRARKGALTPPRAA